MAIDDHTGTEQSLTKKERRELRRQQARVEQARSSRGRGVRRVMMWGAVLLVLVGIGWLVWRAAQNATVNNGGGRTLAVAVGPEDNSKGADDAPITLVEYGDYQCPACGAFHPVVEQLFEEAQGQVRLVFRHYPLRNIHPNADTAARAVQAAGLQDSYWEMHNIVFERQTEWSSIPRGAARNKMLEYAGELGLNTEQMDGDMDSDAVKDKINDDLSGGQASGVNSTPSFFLNGERISEFNSLEDFRSTVLSGLSTQEDPPDEESLKESNDESDGASAEDL